MDKLDIRGNYQYINLGAILFLDNFGPQFTGTANGHIQTDIAGAASVTGLMLLRATVPDLDRYEPGAVVLSEVHDRLEHILRFMQSAAHSFGMDPQGGWNTLIPDEHQPLLDTLELTHRLEKPLYDACAAARAPRDFYPHIAALAAIKLVGAGVKLNHLTLDVGKALAAYYIVAGSKTVPYPSPASG